MTTSPAHPLSARFSEALTYAATLHRHQKRKGIGTPYLAHLLAVSSLVLEDGGTEDEAIGGLLHDAAEDQGREILPYLREVFGDVVHDIVKECSDALPKAGEEKPLWLERKTAYVAHLRGAGLSTLRVSAADKLHNARSTVADLRTTGGWPPSNTCVHRNLWYYAALEQAFRERLPDSRTVTELSLAVDELYRLTPGVGPRGAVGPGPDGCDCTGPTGASENALG
jgi:(p)ppGpp synthase/HD superfamily hydrolase